MAAVANCILALLNHPEVLQKAYEEIDRVIKPGHLPDFEDQESLPYISAIVKESARWRDTAPLCELMSSTFISSFLWWYFYIALPHSTHSADEYRGYRIPKGSIVLANAW